MKAQGQAARSTGQQKHRGLFSSLRSPLRAKSQKFPQDSHCIETRGLDFSDATHVGDSTSAVSSLGVPLPGEESLESQNNCIKPHNLENKLSPGFQLFSKNFIITYLNSGGGKKTSTSHMIFNVGSLTLQSA